MDHANLIAIDVHTHAEVSCWNPFDNDRADIGAVHGLSGKPLNQKVDCLLAFGYCL